MNMNIMMRLLIFAFLLECLACTSAPKGYNFKLKGDFINVDTGKVILLSPGDGARELLSAEMKDGQFLLSGRLEEPGVYKLKVADISFPVILDGEDMSLYTDYLLVDTRFLKGSPATRTRLEVEGMLRENYESKANAILAAYYAKTNNGQNPDPEAKKQANDALKVQNEYRARLILDFVKTHSNDLYMPVFIREQMEGNYVWGKEAYELLSAGIRESQPGRVLKEHLDNISHTVEGNVFPVFAAENAQGEMREVNVNDGKVYVIDFWASWCGPCRAEMQNLKKLYKKYEGKPIEFISVSLDKRGKDWRQANTEEQIPWPSLWMKESFNAQLAKQLGIEAIPFIVVVNKEGKIAGKNLRDQALIDKINEALR